MKADIIIGSTVGGFINIFFERILNPLIVLFVVLGFLLFFFFIVKNLAGETAMFSTDKSRGVLSGVIGLTILLTAIAIIWFVGNTGNTLFNSKKATDGLDQIKYIRVNGR